jgi:hypothetical protein
MVHLKSVYIVYIEDTVSNAPTAVSINTRMILVYGTTFTISVLQVSD